MRRRLPTAFLLLITCHVSLAQIDTLKRSSDELFELARQEAFAGKRAEARTLCRAILARNPSYLDVRILMGRTYAWDGDYEQARLELSKVLAVNPSYKDALNALIDAELWDQKFEQAAEVATQGLRWYPNEEDFLFKKARALRALGRDEEVLVLLTQLEDVNPSHSGALSLRKEIKRGSMRNGVGARYATDRFSDVYDPMHYAHVQVSRRTPVGVVFGRVNYSRRFKSEGIQPELEFYPAVAGGVYGYLNYGYSSSDLFPKHRVGAEIYSKIPSSLEASVGIRRLYFDPDRSVTIYTGSLGLYYRSYWFSLRPYLTPKDQALSTSTSLNVRWYYGNTDNYLLVRGGIGFAADERAMQSSTGLGGKEVFYLKAQTLGVGWQQSLSTQYLFFVTFDVTNQELSTRAGEYVTMYSLSIELRARF